ncbi:MAG: hypothetical protein JWM37_302 [Candidatus Saccharibacteria bacterium]|nr:hypothetical protein [Candidatus Saccharibacteria bacterium]
MLSRPDNPHSEKIADVMTDWLRQEIVNADQGRNSYLSDYRKRRNDLFKPFDDSSNFLARKAKSHYSRLVQWVAPYKEEGFRRNDTFAAKLIFASMMEIAGSYRKQCIFEAADANDYHQRRYTQPAGINIGQLAAAELTTVSLDSVTGMDEQARLDYIIGRTLQVNDDNLQLHKQIHTWAIAHPREEGSIATRDGEPVRAMQEAQGHCASLAVAHIVVAASFRDGDYAAVPFLEPKSITDVAGTIYPLAA